MPNFVEDAINHKNKIKFNFYIEKMANFLSKKQNNLSNLQYKKNPNFFHKYNKMSPKKYNECKELRLDLIHIKWIQK